MKIELDKISTDFNGERCYVHARGVLLPQGHAIMTMQKLELSGCDVFYGIEMMKSTDGARTFSKPAYCEKLKRRYFEDGTSCVLCDATPFYHKATGKVILTGHMAWYGADNSLLKEARERRPVYAVYDESTGDFGEMRSIELPETEHGEYFSAGAGCTQIVECENGDLLIPIYYKPRDAAADPWACSAAVIMRCCFDGQTVRLLELGNKLETDVPRGFDEPSVVCHRGQYFLALRNDETGFATKSTDGLHYETPRELCFDDGQSLGNYNTQQHWLTGGGKLWLVYTRRAGNNDHVFRHRAPLFIAEFDPQAMCVVRSTERIAVPERGARLGNFGCQSYCDGEGYIFAAEWMQNGLNDWEICARHGSDNSIFISKITY
ncbi:MAG: exo-alpha-sialidase [Clostridia bacterium]|nr:exo-alpha-sialidase [Clostridia bacterium]